MSREHELWDSYRQYKIGEYQNQANLLRAFYDCCRYGCKREHLDLILQRPNDKQIYLGSGRDDTIIEWIESMDALIVTLRIEVGTDVIGLVEFLSFSGYEWDLQDRGRTNAILNMERYAAVVSDDRGIGEGVGATEIEALANAAVQLNQIAAGKPVTVKGFKEYSDERTSSTLSV